jgi:hypothetical protein
MTRTSSSIANVLATAEILKAGGVGEFIRIAAAELAFKKTLKRAHRRGVDRIVALLAASVPRTSSSSAFADRAGITYTWAFLRGLEEATGAHVDKVYRLGKKAANRRANGKIKGEFVYDYSTALNKVDEAPEIALVFGLADERAIAALSEGHFFWFAEHFARNVSEVIRTVVADEALRQGLNREEVGRALALAIKRELGITGGDRELELPSGWRGTYDEYFEALSANVTTLARSASTVMGIEEAGGVRLVIVNPEDERTCERCMIMSGKEFTVGQARSQLDKLLAARTPEAVKAAQPWYSVKELKQISKKPGHVSDRDSARLAEAGVILPGYHMKCRCTVDLAPGQEIG